MLVFDGIFKGVGFGEVIKRAKSLEIKGRGRFYEIESPC